MVLYYSGRIETEREEIIKKRQKKRYTILSVGKGEAKR